MIEDGINGINGITVPFRKVECMSTILGILIILIFKQSIDWINQKFNKKEWWNCYYTNCNVFIY